MTNRSALAYRPSAFVKGAAALAGGTAGAQLLTVAALPFLTRLYSPEDFELLAVYLALLGMLSSIACLRYEIAIPLPEADAEGAELLAVALLSTAFVSAATLTTCLLWPQGIAALLGVPRFADYLWLLPLGVLMAGLYAGFQYWASRRRRFGLVARSRLVQAGVGVSTQLGAGAAGMAPVGLLFGHMLYGGAGALGLALSAWRQDAAQFRSLTWARLRARALAYRRFPTYSTVEALSNSAAIQVPVILIAAFAIGPEAGFVLLASRVIGAPMQLVGSAIAQVYLARAPEELRAGRLRAFTFGILRPLALAGIPALTLLALIAPEGFALAFGEEWRRAGVLLQWMTPWFILQLLSSPVSMVLHVTGRTGAAMALQLFGLALRCGAVVAAGLLAPHWVAETYAVTGAVFYGVYLVAIAWVLNK